MTYDEHETSLVSGRPVELYRFTLGAVVYRYTSAEDEYTYGAQVFYPRLISRSAPSQSADERQQQLEVTLPITDEVAARFVGIVPGEEMALEILRVHRDDTDQEGVAYWSGRVTGAAYKENATICTLQCRTSEAASSRSIPRYKYQGMCNHSLFDANCRLNKDNFKFDGTVTALATRQVTVPGVSANGASWALGGYVATTNDYRMVVAQSGDVLTLLVDFSANVLGQAVIVYAGCDHLIATCYGKFNNVIRFGGFPYVPGRNPFESGID